MKIACCQFAPRWGDREANMAFVDSLLKRIERGQIDLLVLPEMAFTGYVFNSLDEIMPFLEDKDSGPSVQWAKKQAQQLECFVVVGYPEIEHKDKYYNSLCCVNPQGQVVATYRKTFLYKTDENWAAEGPGFQSQLIPGLGKVGFGICMDINPYRFEADFEAFEFANFHAREQSEIIICSMAWIRGQNVMDTIGYWAARVWPLREHCHSHSIPHMYFIACNRTGTERGVTFAGGSSILDLCGPKIRLLNYMDEDDEGIMIFDTKYHALLRRGQ